MCSSILISHFNASRSINKSQCLHPLIKNLASIVPALLVSITPHTSSPVVTDELAHLSGVTVLSSTSADIKQGTDKKSIDKAIKQVVNILKSKVTQNSISSFLLSDNGSF